MSGAGLDLLSELDRFTVHSGLRDILMPEFLQSMPLAVAAVDGGFDAANDQYYFLQKQ